MSNEAIIGLVFFGLALPVVVFLFVALMSNGNDPASTEADDYLLAGGEASSGDFINSSTGYMIQVSTTFYFIYWGYNYGLSNLFYVVSWAAGIILFALFARQLVEARKVSSTIPSFLGAGSAKLVQVLSACAAILSFAGVFYVEAYFTADLLTGFSDPAGTFRSFSEPWWSIFALIVLVVALYSVLGGLKKVIATDVWQLSLAYLGFAVVFAFLIDKSHEVSRVSAHIMSLIVICIYLAFAITDRGLKDGRVKRYSIYVGVIIVSAVMIKNLMFPVTQSQPDTVLIEGLFKQIIEPWGWATLAGFVVLNTLWQFADSSNFQRISAVKLPEGDEEATNALRSMIRSLALVSPLTWGLGIILGMLIKTASIQVGGPGAEYQALISYLRLGALGGEVWPIAVILSLTVGLVSIMMSTSDTAIVAATQNYVTDIKRSQDFSLVVSIAFAVAVVAMAFILAFVHSKNPNLSILTVMAGAYSAIVVLAPLTIQRLMGRLPNPAVASLAIILGLFSAGFATFGPTTSLPFNVVLVLPIFASVGVSVFVSFVGLPWSKRQSINYHSNSAELENNG